MDPLRPGQRLRAGTGDVRVPHGRSSAGSFADVGYYFDPTHPTEAMADAAATVGAQAPLLWLGAVAVGAIVPLAAAFMGRRSGNWRLWAPVAIIAALAGAVCMRVAFYNLGLSVFMFY